MKTPVESFGMRFYRGFFRLVFRYFARALVGQERWQETLRIPKIFREMPERVSGGHRTWFHAASMGELESLWPLIERASDEPGSSLILTVFSTSAWAHVHRMSRKLSGVSPLYVGYSPLESGWKEALQMANPTLFVTAKYEAWPEMWDGLARLGIPLAIIGAKPRSSILWAKRVLKIFSGLIPKILFVSFDPENKPGLLKAFPGFDIFEGSDPRWDRVFQRSEAVHPRVTELVRQFVDLERPWGVVGSAWPGDVNSLPADCAKTIPGTLWLVPHRVDPKHVSEIEILLRDRGFTPVRTSVDEPIRPAGKIAILVDEMGFLTELYSKMDWAFIGGGFTSSIHSTIEPAIYGLPIYGGPRGQQKFDEIALLKKQGQLHLYGDHNQVRTGTREDFHFWFQTSALKPMKEKWTTMNQRHRGASGRIWERLRLTANVLETF